MQVADKFIKLLSWKKPESCKLIVSSHNYENAPSAEELGNLVAQMQAAGADIVKIATTATEIVDVARMFQILKHCQVSLTSDYTEYMYLLVTDLGQPGVARGWQSDRQGLRSDRRLLEQRP
jgi:3-dehydroquinate dehydratase type I